MHLVRLPFPSVNVIYTCMYHGKISSVLDFQKVPTKAMQFYHLIIRME